MTDANSRLPSGRPLRAARNDAKRLAHETGIPLSVAQDRVAQSNGAAPGWAKAVQAIRSAAPAPAQLTSASRPTMTRADLQKVFENHPITRYGYGPSDDAVRSLGSYQSALQKGQAELLEHMDECSKALQFLAHVEMRKTNNPRVGTSYGLKHRAEGYIRWTLDRPEIAYVSNGAFICAALHLGFELRTWGSPNVTFNMSSRSPVFEWGRLKAKARTDRLPPSSFQRLGSLEDQLGLEKTPNPWGFLN